MLFERREQKRVGRSIYFLSCVYILILCSSIMLIAHRVTDDKVPPQEFSFGHSTVWPNYGCPTIDDGDEYAHGWFTLMHILLLSSLHLYR